MMSRSRQAVLEGLEELQKRTRASLRRARESNARREDIAFWEDCLRAEQYARIECFESFYPYAHLPERF